jgi:hypothetical protein
MLADLLGLTSWQEPGTAGEHTPEIAPAAAVS